MAAGRAINTGPGNAGGGAGNRWSDLQTSGPGKLWTLEGVGWGDERLGCNQLLVR